MPPATCVPATCRTAADAVRTEGKPMPQLDRAGTRIFYEVTGDADGQPPLLLSHGFGASSARWHPNRAALAAARQVITWDMRGHGRSDSPADPAEYTHAACVADMAALLDAAGAERAVAGGLSLGGFLSLAFCLEMPERVAALMLCDTGPGFRSDDARQRWNSRALATADRLERNGLGAVGDDSGPAAPGHRSASGLALAARHARPGRQPGDRWAGIDSRADAG